MHRILVTGASSGIGRALALRLASQGHRVLAVSRRLELLESLQSHVPRHIETLQADVSKEADRQRIVDVAKQQGPLTHVVHNAGIIEPVSKLADVKLEDYRLQHSINTEAPLFLTQALLPYVAEGCRFLFVTSGAAHVPWQGIASYSISKAGADMVWRVFKQEYEEKDVYFAGLRPGGVATPMVDRACGYPTSILPAGDVMRQRKAEGTLLEPETAAGFIEWVLLKASNSEFEKSWNINEPEDTALWEVSQAQQ